MMQIFNIGTVAGRHDLPVDNYVFTKVDEPNNIKWLEQYAFTFIQNLIGNDAIKVVNYPKTKPVSHIGTKEDAYLEADIELHLYITGLTQATLAIINAARRLHIHNLYVHHYDIFTKEFVQQKIIY